MQMNESEKLSGFASERRYIIPLRTVLQRIKVHGLEVKQSRKPFSPLPYLTSLCLLRNFPLVFAKMPLQ
jgi:hypothetical protein